jgi:hypothetical protein
LDGIIIMLKQIGPAALAAVFLLAGAPAAQAQDTSIGYLSCEVGGSVSFIFGSTRDVTCTYEPTDDTATHHYSGTIERYGIDIGYMESSVMIWGVAVASEGLPKGGLEGEYAGVSAEIAAVYGVGVNALILGENSIALQPISVEGGEGFNIAAGVAQLNLRADKQ